MPRDMSRVTYDENGGMVTAIPKGTPKDAIKAAKAAGKVDKNDPAYDTEDAKKDAEEAEQATAEKGGGKRAYGTRKLGSDK